MNNPLSPFGNPYQYMAELISLGLTIPTVATAIAVVYRFYPVALAALIKRERSENEWLVLGIVLGFIGQTLDNLYWFFPWSSSFLGLEYTETLINAGVFFNIPFRQTLGLSAATCHLKAYCLADSKALKSLNAFLLSSALAGCAYSLSLIAFRA